MFKHIGIALCIYIYSAASVAKWYQETFKVMGTLSHVEFWLEQPDDKLANALILAVKTEMNRIDQQMSPYKANSELSRVNRTASQQQVKISAELFDLLLVAQKISQLSDGAFDLTFASIGYQYDYRAHKKPSVSDIKQALPTINYHSIILNRQNRSVYFNEDKVKIDLGGIAKGYAVKRCLALLKHSGVRHALVSAGGDTGLLGDRLGRPWVVGIKHPRAKDKTAVRIPLTNEAISTSGDYERYFIEDGVRYHHIINPKTGDSARKVVSVSVIGKDPTYVDALSTTIFVKGLTEGLALINKLPEFEAIIIDNKQQLYFSNGLQ
jgi:thiamine biosynthesis lipoprotein